LSWDVEEYKLQVQVPSPDEESTLKSNGNNLHNPISDDENITTDDGNDSPVSEESNVDSEDSPKLKYRCKLCGQPKQNHTCPFQQALQRSIGTMTYSGLNAFQCHEPGELATPLCEMNNFVDLENDDDCEDSMLINHPKRQVGTLPSFRLEDDELIGKKRKTRINSNVRDSTYQGNEKLLHDVMDIKPEQYKLVSTHGSNLIGDFKYVTLPLTYDQRRGASEDLFESCQEISGLTDECAKVLDVARKTDLWDLAVAELITQIIVATKCRPGDEVLNGLRKHLAHMGISC
jgi:hypothetical protein